MPVVEQAGAGTPFSDGTVAVIDRALRQAFPGVDPVELRDGVRVGILVHPSATARPSRTGDWLAGVDPAVASAVGTNLEPAS